MNDTNLVCNFLIIWGLVLTVGVPLIFGYFIVGFTERDEKNVILSTIGACSLLISIIVLEVIV